MTRVNNTSKHSTKSRQHSIHTKCVCMQVPQHTEVTGTPWASSEAGSNSVAGLHSTPGCEAASVARALANASVIASLADAGTAYHCMGLPQCR